MTWIRDTEEGAVINLRVIPRASKNRVEGLYGNVLKVRLQAPPVEGKANKALLKFLSDVFDIPATQLAILSGETGRNKRLLVRGHDAGYVTGLLGLPMEKD